MSVGDSGSQEGVFWESMETLGSPGVICEVTGKLG